MACHEISALRLGLMQVLGRKDEAERQHELSELGTSADRPGPIRSMCEAKDLKNLKQFYETSLSELEERVSVTPVGDPKLPYLRSLVVLTKKVELELSHQIDNLTHLYQDLEEMHNLVHEIYPKE